MTAGRRPSARAHTARPASVYLDHNATSPLRPEAAAAAAEAMALGGNPSSVHGPGRRARALLETARETLAATIDAPAAAVIFTSGATEADNLAIASMVAGGARRLLISAVEHDAVREAAAASGAAVETIPVDANGVVDLAWLERRLAAWGETDGGGANGRPGVALMLANNETGVIQPVAQAARLVRAVDGLLVVDAVQGLGRVDVSLDALGADYLALSAHKIGGPAGVGALAVSARAPVSRMLHGGGQERGHRGGMANLPGAAGFAAAAVAAVGARADQERLRALRDGLERAALAARPQARILGADAPRLGNTSCLALPGFASETQVMALDMAGVAVSAGAACSSGKVRASHVLVAMGCGAEVAGCAIRISFGWTSTAADAARFGAAWTAAAERARLSTSPSTDSQEMTGADTRGVVLAEGVE